MSDTYTIGQLAKLANVPALRCGIMSRRNCSCRWGAQRAIIGCMVLQSLEQLRFIKAAQASGFTLEDISTLLSIQRGRLEPCGAV